ncbi:hypothetical protein [uncultured Metabacillus sp.]|uniref:DUF7394 family protein n=1 Tax=uncultured Metabacillus sp. TaxID=2860135 RepID=UPI002630A709|nr:hypothetical protein [uncultured Metabacillus sp.]
MGVELIGIGVVIIKVCAFGSLGAGIITGVKWFAKFDPTFKKKSSLGGGDSDNNLEHLRKAIRQSN